MSVLKPIEINRSVTFFSPLEGKNEQLVRTGTLGPLIHAMLHASDNVYITKSNSDRKEYANDIIMSLSDEKKWSGTESGIVSIDENIREIFTQLYDYIKNGTDYERMTEKVMKKVKIDEKIKLYEIISELIPLKEIMKTETVLEYLDNVPEIKNISSNKASVIRSVVSVLVDTVKNVATSSAYKNYKKSVDIDDPEIIPLICERLNRDIFLIDGADRVPYYWKGSGTGKTLIAITMGKNYEPVGRLLSGKRIQREFTSDDPLVSKMKMFLESPSDVKNKFPELLPYLTDRKKKSDSESDSESDSDSESESDSD